ncbi:unnamed protein product [Leptidea sinapis]|uniref:Endonuclease/exonuclease/phosphatase domain-containing protein n=1 Tax=Leptidea sinapis TaxID=189913 RepID=A0A5E4PZI0_9NEOP|nr:unnamed protein product [Leptidea sinapis]
MPLRKENVASVLSFKINMKRGLSQLNETVVTITEDRSSIKASSPRDDNFNYRNISLTNRGVTIGPEHNVIVGKNAENESSPQINDSSVHRVETVEMQYHASHVKNHDTNEEEKFRTVERKIPLFITNVHKDTAESDIINYIKNKTNENHYKKLGLCREGLFFLDTISENFRSTGVSAVDKSASILRSRPYGGAFLLWRRSIFQNVSVIYCDNARICAKQVVLQGKSFKVIRVYMPTDAVVNRTNFTGVLCSLSAIINSHGENCAYILRDFNADPSERCIDTDVLGLLSDTYTFISEVNGSKRWLGESAKDSVCDIFV